MLATFSFIHQKLIIRCYNNFNIAKVRKIYLQTRILVIEDETDIQNIIKAFLESEGYLVCLAGDGLAGFNKFNEQDFDLVLLDIMLPKIDGFTVCQMIRKQSDIPIVMLTALSSEEDQIKGFENLADDYITKPFSMKLLIKRVEAVLRRTEDRQDADKLKYQQILVDRKCYKAYFEDQLLELTKLEFEILEFFVLNPRQVFSREQLLDRVWGMDYFGDPKLINTHIKNLRKKLPVDYIKTIRGVGYSFE